MANILKENGIDPALERDAGKRETHMRSSKRLLGAALCALGYEGMSSAQCLHGKTDLPCESKPLPPPLTYKPEKGPAKPLETVHPTVVTVADSKGKEPYGPVLSVPFGGGDNNDKPK